MQNNRDGSNCGGSVEQLATLASKRINDRLTVNSPLSFHQYRELQEKKYKRP